MWGGARHCSGTYGSVDWFIGTLVHVAMFPKILTMLNYILQPTQYKSNWRQNDFSLSYHVLKPSLQTLNLLNPRKCNMYGSAASTWHVLAVYEVNYPRKDDSRVYVFLCCDLCGMLMLVV